MIHAISAELLSLGAIQNILAQGATIELSEDAVVRINKCKEFLDLKIASSKVPIYGITTGFGSLCDTNISSDDLGQLQRNLVMSHACGIGEEVDLEIVKLMILLKIQGLSYGHSGVRLETVERLVTFFNEDVMPVVFDQGSLGASGDLSPLSHLALALIGKGDVYHNGVRKTAKEMYEELDLSPLQLEAKEGLALLNGTQFMNAYGVFCLIRAHRINAMSDIIGSLSLDAWDGRPEPFDDSVHLIRAHAGQLRTARNIRKLLEGSEMITRQKEHVQDPYSFRCMPQVHGASKDVIAYATSVFETEVNAVTDNPTIFPDEDKIVSAGNFHGQPLALALDSLAIALAELGSISERRTYKLISGQRDLPDFLVANPGLNSGFMIPQYTSASIVSQNKQLCTPCSVDTIDSSNGQEDHVSMGANAATKTLRVTENVEKILAIELFNAAQAMDMRAPIKTSKPLAQLVADYRKVVPFVDDDIINHNYMIKSLAFIGSYDFESMLEGV